MFTTKITAEDGFRISVAYFPHPSPKGLVQLVHGAHEHKERYYPFIEFLNENGYACVISDNRGHGASIDENYPFGHMENVEEQIQDLFLTTKYIKKLYPDKPLFLFGHSLGSLYARVYLQRHDEEIKKLVLTGTANYVRPAKFGTILMKLVVVLAGGKYKTSRFLNGFYVGGKKNSEWISYSRENLRAVESDPLMLKGFTNGGLKTVVEADAEIKRYGKFLCKNPDLPILSLSGEDDPVTGGKRGLKDTKRTLNKIGYKNFVYEEFPHMMHEILNEEDRQKVYERILSFFEEKGEKNEF